MPLSRAVVERRAHEAPDELEYFPTQPWAVRAFCEWLTENGGFDLSTMTCWEPACGELHMVKPLRESFGKVRATDVHRYGQNHGLADFLVEGRTLPPAEWIITNPPFPEAANFVDVALEKASRGVAMLVRSSWLEGSGRYAELFKDRPPSYVVTSTERIVMLQGRLIRTGAPDPFNLDDKGKPRKATTATSYSWAVWVRWGGREWDHDTRHRWIGPCRQRLERDSDYPDYSAQLAEIEARASAQRSPDQGGLFTEGTYDGEGKCR